MTSFKRTQMTSFKGTQMTSFETQWKMFPAARRVAMALESHGIFRWMNFFSAVSISLNLFDKSGKYTNVAVLRCLLLPSQESSPSHFLILKMFSCQCLICMYSPASWQNPEQFSILKFNHHNHNHNEHHHDQPQPNGSRCSQFLTKFRQPSMCCLSLFPSVAALIETIPSINQFPLPHFLNEPLWFSSLAALHYYKPNKFICSFFVPIYANLPRFGRVRSRLGHRILCCGPAFLVFFALESHAVQQPDVFLYLLHNLSQPGLEICRLCWAQWGINRHRCRDS